MQDELGDSPICLDYNATTPHAPEVIDAIRPYLEEEFGMDLSREEDVKRVLSMTFEEFVDYVLERSEWQPEARPAAR